MSKCFGDCGKLRDLFSKKNTEPETKKQMVTEWYYGDDSTIENYIESKLKMLRKDMLIEPTDDEIRQLNRAKTTISVDNLVHSIIGRHWDEL